MRAASTTEQMTMSERFAIHDLEDFAQLRVDLGVALLAAPSFSPGVWQSKDVSSRPEMATREVTNVMIQIPIGPYQPKLAMLTDASMPWAEDHFQERVSGEPLNPPPSEAWWPFAQAGNAAHKKDQKFSHTYPERFWPKFANTGDVRPNGRQVFVPHNGIRYEYGDLADVVSHLNAQPYSRQAYLPVWFPEDTGAVHGERVPCTLGYQFLHRGGYMDVTYHIRSCDFMRHWRDDVYMAGRLLQWMSEQVDFRPIPRNLIMNIGSFHIFEGDVEMLKAVTQKLISQIEKDKSRKLMEAFG